MPAEPHSVTATLGETLRAAGVVGVLRAGKPEAATEAARAAARGGLRVIEATFTTPGAPGVLRTLSRELAGQVAVGAGTVMNAVQAREAIEAGAAFLVSPHLGEDVLEVACEAGVPYLPGVITPTEIVRARSLGVQIIKLFPIGSSGGVAYLGDLLGPLPELQVMVTGGVTPGEVPAYRAAGALAVGLGSNFFPAKALAGGDWDAVERATREALAQAGCP